MNLVNPSAIELDMSRICPLCELPLVKLWCARRIEVRLLSAAGRVNVARGKCGPNGVEGDLVWLHASCNHARECIIAQFNENAADLNRVAAALAEVIEGDVYVRGVS